MVIRDLLMLTNIAILDFQRAPCSHCAFLLNTHLILAMCKLEMTFFNTPARVLQSMRLGGVHVWRNREKLEKAKEGAG
jgi:hypothetical protein